MPGHCRRAEISTWRGWRTRRFVPATARSATCSAQMQSSRAHFAFVIDEHGGIEGILTLEDLLEEIVGEIRRRVRRGGARADRRGADGTYLLDGMLAVRDANRRFKLRLPEEAGYTTLAGFLLARAGRILLPGEAVEHEGGTFTVEHVEGRRIRRVRYTPPPRRRRAGGAGGGVSGIRLRT